MNISYDYTFFSFGWQCKSFRANHHEPIDVCSLASWWMIFILATIEPVTPRIKAF